MGFNWRCAMAFLLGFFILPRIARNLALNYWFDILRINVALALAILFGYLFGGKK